MWINLKIDEYKERNNSKTVANWYEVKQADWIEITLIEISVTKK
jgi:hypothetical protein